MNILITGGAGFIGSHLAEHLLEQGHSVIALDNLSTGSLGNIRHLLNRKGFSFVQEDVRNSQTLHVLVPQCDSIFHLAAAVGVKLIVEQPVHTIETNIHGTEVVLAVANKFRKKVLIASTSEVYGKSEAIPFYEDDDTVLGSTRFSRWSYACSKAIDEFLALAYHQQYGLEAVIVRLFNTVGPRQTGQYGMVVPRFVEKALKNEPIEIYGTGQQSRCFCCVHDVVRALGQLMVNPDTAGRVYNLGTDREITIDQLADMVIGLTESRSEKKFLSYEQAYGKPFDDMIRRVPGLKRIQEAIGYRPEFGLEKTLELVIRDIKSRLYAQRV
ncbi:MAG TPA: GDP-mannose 4,6-dehydratase [Anaerohalosphaeraceae bacterium]|nr:GDP-mannose 4,6-dehydratase [Anaerohalosphaeraceae bacterium]